MGYVVAMPCAGQVGLSVIVLLLDDMRLDQLPVLEATDARLAEHAVVFDRAYVTTPMCCPERASFLSGGFLPQHTGVLTNESPRGGATVFPDQDTLATRLQGAGYATALYGKYLNDYEKLGEYVPPGWTDWAAVEESDPWTDFEVRVGQSTPEASASASVESVAAYVTTWQGEVASAFLTEHEADPFFIYVSFRAPHEPADPAPGDKGAYRGTQYRGGAYEEADVSDKPAWIQEIPLWTADEEAIHDSKNAARLETLLSADRAIVAVFHALQEAGRTEDTLVVVTSDNGQQWGEHRLIDKGVGYEESVHMPLVLWNPAFTPRHTSALVASNLDIAATITDLAGLPARGDGLSLRSVACGDTDTLRELVPLQGWPYTEPAWSGVVTDQWKYLETASGERELYDLDADPIEAESVVALPENEALVASLAAALDEVRGLAVKDNTLPGARVGSAYSAELSAWGGVPPYRWTLVQGALPQGLTLDPTGNIRGTPERAGAASFSLEVADSSVSAYDGMAQADRREFSVNVTAEECGCSSSEAGLGAIVFGAVAIGRRRRS